MHIEVDVSAVKRNIRQARRIAGCAIGGVVKAECYGHGLTLAKYIEAELGWFCVSSTDEAIALRKIGLCKPIHILGSPSCHNLSDIILTITDLSSFKVVCNMALVSDFALVVDVEINTGMNRTGVTPLEFEQILPLIFANNKLKLRGIFTHFADGNDLDFCQKQLAIFDALTSRLPNNIIKHCCATNFCKLPKKFFKDAIRLGLGMYGYGGAEFVPALSAVGYVVQVNWVKAGERVGYGNNVVTKDTHIATVDFGYGDGVSRALSNRCGKIEINEQLFDIVGTVCMDMIMVDVGNVAVSTGDKANYISKQNNATQIAKAIGTIEYEVLTKVNLRSKYVYR
ncbi:MAG: alanine racemase [Firmicutes bacterium]|nr:alanine racemase [Bacillota bacterium]